MTLTTNAEIAEKFGIPLSKARRHAKDFLLPDPKASFRTGITRAYGLNDAFIIHLGGWLVSFLGLTVADANRILDEIMPWLERVGLQPEVVPHAKRSGIDNKIIDYSVRIMLDTTNKRWVCQAVGVLEAEKGQAQMDETGRQYYTEKTESCCYNITPNASDDFSPERSDAKILDVQKQLIFFLTKFYSPNHSEILARLYKTWEGIKK